MSTQEESCKVSIRTAIELDILQLISIAKEYKDEADRWGILQFDADRAVYYAALAIEDPNQQIFIAQHKGEIVGFMWCAVVGQVWTSQPIGQDLILYVRKGYRDSHVGLKLVEEFEKWAKASGAVVIQTGAHSGIKNDAAASQLYLKRGYAAGGANFFKLL